MKSCPGNMTTDVAQAVALNALTFIASDETRLGALMEQTGATPETLRAQLASPAFQAAILNHLLSDESLLLVFCSNMGLSPDQIAPAHARLTAIATDGTP